MKIRIFVLSAVVIVTACNRGKGEGGTSEINREAESIEMLERGGEIPTLERGSSVAGVDANKDGIRDDIEAYIDLHFPNPSQHAAARQSAKALQKAILIDLGNIGEVKDANRGISRADHCNFSRFDTSYPKKAAQISMEIEAITTNTKERLLAYLAFSEALDGTSWAMPEGDTCE